ncbi:hypothetical protein F442_11800 [Phytophthora nicotianae P10297]|uniref:Uncharacterized protein n=1 Tax=Phytophthora nicotianae P10297 TaxID=1317064 RepID=W2Z1V0_PHYNI|nr:hypothetical protein F442_11800 [Phytophthora nicotianae P10297]
MATTTCQGYLLFRVHLALTAGGDAGFSGYGLDGQFVRSPHSSFMKTRKVNGEGMIKIVQRSFKSDTTFSISEH